MDPLEKLSDEQLRLLAADVMVQLEKGTGTRPILFMLADARARAAQAFNFFIDADPADMKIIAALQQELRLYVDMIQSCRGVLERGKEADRRIAENDREAIDEMVMNMSDEERRLYRFEPRGTD